MPPPEPIPAPHKPKSRTFRRHQVGALLSSAVDFSAMTLAHEILGISPVFATVVGATCGGVFNFTLGRSWVFGARHGALWSQALRYAAVSFGCVVLNALGMALLATRFGAHFYVVQRAGVSVLVSVLWSYPAQRRLVFGGRPLPAADGELAETALDEPR